MPVVDPPTEEASFVDPNGVAFVRAALSGLPGPHLPYRVRVLASFSDRIERLELVAPLWNLLSRGLAGAADLRAVGGDGEHFGFFAFVALLPRAVRPRVQPLDHLDRCGRPSFLSVRGDRVEVFPQRRLCAKHGLDPMSPCAASFPDATNRRQAHE